MSECSCQSAHHHDHVHQEISWLPIAISLVFLIIAELIVPYKLFKEILLVFAYLIVSYKILLQAIKNVLQGELFDENFLMSLASIIAFIMGQRIEAIAVMVFYSVGEYLQEKAVVKSRRNIVELMDLRPDSANLMVDDKVKVVDPKCVNVGDIILVKPGEKIPLDGVVVFGEGYVDTKALSGESDLKLVNVASSVYAGMISYDGVLKIEVSKEYSDSLVAKILEMVENAAAKKSKSEKFITKFAKIYTPAVVVLASLIVVVPVLLGFGAFNDWLFRGLNFLIISCPCALVISIPVSYFGGVGAAARSGILVKGANYLETIDKVKVMVFDKTGTLTKGNLEVEELISVEGTSKDELLYYGAVAEANSNHPLASAIKKAYGKDINSDILTQEIAGKGVISKSTIGEIAAGNRAFIQELCEIDLPTYDMTVVYIVKDSVYQGAIIIGDELKDNSKDNLLALKDNGIDKLVMLTGDSDYVASKVAKDLPLDYYKAQLLPNDKVTAIEEIITSVESKVAFIGDGINDAPVLMRSDVGIAMGQIGSDAAIEASDVVIVNDDLNSLVKVKKIARKTSIIVKENIFMALGVKGAVMLLSVIGFANIWLAIFADVGVALLAVANASRIIDGVK